MSRYAQNHEVARWHERYMAGESMTSIARSVGRCRSSLHDNFARRGLFVRPFKGGKRDPKSGRILPGKIHTAREITAIINGLSKVTVPPELKREWREWPMDRRQNFIRRLRARITEEYPLPTGPYSANVRAFSYGDPEAIALINKANVGRDSRHKITAMKPSSQGVIFEEQLWFWTGDGYARWQAWTPDRKRPHLHRVLWQRHHGPVPPSQTVIFIDHNKNNLLPENLGLRSRALCAAQNSSRRWAAASRRKIQALLALAQNKDKNENTDLVRQIAGDGMEIPRDRDTHGRHHARAGRILDHAKSR